MKRLLFVAALLVSAFSSSAGQSLPQLPRATVATGLNDSTLVYVSDSAKRSRAAVAPDFRKMLSLQAFDSLVTANLRLTSVVNGSATWASTQTFASGQRVDSATGAARAHLLTTARTLWGQSFNGSANVTAAPTFGAGATVSSGQNLVMTGASITGSPTATLGAITVSSCSGCSSGSATVTDTVRAVTFDSVRATRLLPTDSIRFKGTTSAILGGTGNMNIAAGTGNSRKLTIQTTTSGGVATTAVRFNEAQQSLFASGAVARPGIAFAADSTTGFWRNGSGNPEIAIVGTTVWSFSGGGGSGNILSGGAGNGSIQSGTGNSRTLTLITTTSAGTAKNTLVLGADSSATFLGQLKMSFNTGSITSPAIGWADSVGFYRTGANRSFTMIAGNATGSSGVILNPLAGSRYVQLMAKDAAILKADSVGVKLELDGTAALPSLSFTSSINSGFRLGSNGATDTVVFVSNATDALKLVGAKAFAPALTAASGTPNTVCINSATKEITENAATSCVVSSLRFKSDVLSLSPTWATSKLMGLQPTSFTYKDGGRHALGLIAENADSVDSRLGFRDAEGRVNSYDQAGVLALLTSTVQELVRKTDRQGATIDSLRIELAKVKKP
jgi:hypothetical protein